jgi:ABC-type transport system substrate-binding protein
MRALDVASELTNIATARTLWARADRIATRQAPLVALFDDSGAVFVSARVRNYQESPQYGPLVDQMWVR